MKLTEMHERRKALVAERDSLLASDAMSVEQEARGHEVANELQTIDAQIRAAQLRERFASYTAVEKAVGESQKRDADWTATPEYRDQFVNWCRGGREPERREITTGTGSGILVPKLYETQIYKYLDANTVVRNLADLRTGVKGYPTLRWNDMVTNDYDNAWTQVDTSSSAVVNTDPGFLERAIAPQPLAPITTVSRQSLVQSDFDLEAEVMDHLQRQIAKNLEWGYVGGSGTHQPTGIFTVNADANITTATSGGTTRAAAITAGVTVAKLSEMRYTKLPAAYWGSSAWILPQDVYAAIAGILVNGVPIFVPSADASLVGAAPFTLMGLPVYVTEYLPAHVATATTGKNVLAVLGNIRDGFAVREWGGMTMYRDEVTGAGTGRIKFGAWMFANSNFTRVKSLVQLQVTNA